MENKDLITDKELDNALNNIDSSLENLRNILKKLSKLQGYYDQAQSEFYHLFENSKFPANVRAKLDKEFDECLKNRRDVKVKLAKVTSIVALLKNKGIDTIINEKQKGCGTFNVQILKEIYNKYGKYMERDYNIQGE